MTITIELRPNTEAKVVQQAAMKGLAIEEFLSEFIETNLNGEEEKPFYETATFEEWENEFNEWVESHTYTGLPIDDSRESIYREREDSQL
jgi:hypothetical protein